ncbi:MAG: hypothetical protein ACP59X_14345 [Solidesulfovibrio sp. DCME]|uniref:hypothetical protein n=1 Tax=Solidesulfovibrio sp. DCME TaxID=3447380 RepID=UPI003D0F63E2
MRTQRADIRRAPSTAAPALLAGGTVLGDLTNNGGLAAAFDGTTAQTQSASAAKTISSSGYNNTVGAVYLQAYYLDFCVVNGPMDTNILGAGGGTTFNVEASLDGTTWVALASAVTIITGAGSATPAVILATVPYRYFRVNMEGNGSNTIAVAEVRFYGRPA